MITDNANLDSAELGELGWGFKSIVKKVGSGAAGVAKATGKTAFKAGTTVVKKGVVAPVKTAAKGVAKLSKAAANLALRPVRSRLNTLKDRRAKLLAVQRRGVAKPTVAEQAQARKDVKSMLSRKGPHGKMLSWLAGPDTYDGLGVAGYDDIALAAIATALTASLTKIIKDAANSKFAPVDAIKEAGKAGATSAVTSVVPQKYQDIYTAAKAAPAPAAASAPAPAPEPTEPVTQEEVAAEPEVQAEEAATEAETEAMEGALRGAGVFGGFMEALPAAAAPEAMEPSTARKIAGAAQRLICAMSGPSIANIAGTEGLRAAQAFCRGFAAGDDVTVRATLPTVVQIAARASAGLTADAINAGLITIQNQGFGATGKVKVPTALQVFRTWGYDAQGRALYMRNDVAAQAARARYIAAHPAMDASEATRPAGRNNLLFGVDNDDVGMLAAFAGADPAGLAYGLAGVDTVEIQGATSSALALAPAVVAVLAGLWMATH